jgi:putative CocE/NonD family hydrolase
MRALASLFFGVALVLSLSLSQIGASDPLIQKDIPIKMRDGVTLLADVVLPASEGKFPVLVYRTPYGKAGAVKAWTTFDKAVARGYAVVIQDVRGRYASSGDFDPYRNEGRDGYDTIEWAAVQPWSNGVVGTFGLSYPGAVQWLAAVENPPHLKAMVPAMTFSTPRNFFYSGGVFDGSWLDWIWFNIAPDARKRKHLPGPQTHKEAAAAWKTEHERLQNFLPMADLPDLKQAAPFYYDWLAHPPASTWWDWAELGGKYDRVQAAVLNISGWYDEAYGPDGATTNFNGLLAVRKSERNPRTATIIGAWTHGELGRSKAGEREFGKSAAVDYDEIILRWMDHYLKGVANRVENDKPVRIFVMGANTWRDEDAWPLTRTKQTPLYLSSGRTPDGTLSLDAGLCTKCESYAEFVSDPAHPVSDPYDEFGARDYRSFAGRKDILLFDSAPLSSDLEVTGPIRAEMYVSADVRDFDLWVRILDVSPDGAAYNLMSPGLDVLRASYRDNSVKPELLKPGKIYRLELNRLLTSNVFQKGHRIRVQVSGAFFPHFSRNLQTGNSEIISSGMRTGHIRIYNDAQHPSRIVLPAIPARMSSLRLFAPRATHGTYQGRREMENSPLPVLLRTAPPATASLTPPG